MHVDEEEDSQFFEHSLYRQLRLAVPLFLFLLECKAYAIDAVPLVRRSRISLSFEHMPQMTPAVAANNLCPLHA